MDRIFFQLGVPVSDLVRLRETWEQTPDGQRLTSTVAKRKELGLDEEPWKSRAEAAFNEWLDAFVENLKRADAAQSAAREREFRNWLDEQNK